MSEAEQLSTLIDDIYAAALDRSLRADVLRRAAEFVCAQAGGLLSRDAVRKSADVHDEFGVDLHSTQRRLNQYAELDPTGSPLLFSGAGGC